jgi:transcriptional regulator GlxA family with amidase domain
MLPIAVVAVPPVKPFDLTMPSLLLGNVEVDGAPGYDVVVCTAEPGLVPSEQGLDIVVTAGLEAVQRAHTVIVPSTGNRHDIDAVTSAALRSAAEAGKRVAAICTGAFVLAQAGLLDGRRATTHWAYAEDLAKAHPSVDVDPNVLYIDEGPVLTCAGSAAGIDLCLHLIRRDYGAAAAAVAARIAVVTPGREGGQAQFVDTPLPPERGVSLAAARAWALSRLDRPIALDDFAREARVSVRTLTRRFTAETGMTPFQWLLRQRLHRARELLESTELTVDQVARRSGGGAPPGGGRRRRAAEGLELVPLARIADNFQASS